MSIKGLRLHLGQGPTYYSRNITPYHSIECKLVFQFGRWHEVPLGY